MAREARANATFSTWRYEALWDNVVSTPDFLRSHMVLRLPVRPRKTAAGHVLPFIHPSIPPARPRIGPAWRQQAFPLVVGLPVKVLCSAALSVLRRVRGGSTHRGLAWLLQRSAFWAMTRVQDEGAGDREQLPVVFPTELLAQPVDAGIVEPVFVLHAMGLRTRASSQGHEPGGAPYVLLESGCEFPPSLLESLAEQGVAYDIRRFQNGRQGIYPSMRQPSAALAEGLRVWARQQGALLH